MPRSSGILAILLTLVPLAIVEPLNLLEHQVITANRDILFLVGTLPLYAYAAYWAFGTRRSFAVRIYRSQALSTGIFALVLWFSFYAFVVFSTSPNLQLSAATTTIAFSLSLLAFFY